MTSLAHLETPTASAAVLDEGGGTHASGIQDGEPTATPDAPHNIKMCGSVGASVGAESAVVLTFPAPSSAPSRPMCAPAISTSHLSEEQLANLVRIRKLKLLLAQRPELQAEVRKRQTAAKYSAPPTFQAAVATRHHTPASHQQVSPLKTSGDDRCAAIQAASALSLLGASAKTARLWDSEDDTAMSEASMETNYFSTRKRDRDDEVSGC